MVNSFNLAINPETGEQVALILFMKFNSAEGIFGHHTMPEAQLPRWGSDLTASGLERGSYEHLMFVTLVVSIDYQRDADQLWAAGRKTFEDGGTRWVFYPEKLVSNPENVKSALQAHKLSKKPTKDAEIRFKVSKSFLEKYNSNPLNMIAECDYDAVEIYRKKFDPKFKISFPYFSGNKIFPLWIRMLHDNVKLPLRNIDKIPIPVDVHIARATFATGCLTGEYRGTISGVSSKIDESWKTSMVFLKDDDLKYRLQLDEPLWHLSRFGCKFRKDNTCPKRSRCPVGQFCVEGIVKVSTKKVEIRTGQRSATNTLLNDFAS